MARFIMKAAEQDRTGYYYVRWDRAIPITVCADTRQEAYNKAAEVLGACRNDPRGWSWTFHIQSIDVCDHLTVTVGAQEAK